MTDKQQKPIITDPFGSYTGVVRFPDAVNPGGSPQLSFPKRTNPLSKDKQLRFPDAANPGKDSPDLRFPQAENPVQDVDDL